MDRARVLNQIKSEYTQHMESDADIRRLYAILKNDKGKQPDALEFAKVSGGKMADSVINNVVPELGVGEALAIEDALVVIPDMLRSNHEYVNQYLFQLQTKLDEKAKIGLKPLTAPFDADRAAGLAEAATLKPFDELTDAFKSQVQNFAMHVVDEGMQMTAESRSRAGLTVLVSRKYDDVGLRFRTQPCQWCLDRECSEIPYQEAYEQGVFERHQGCECLITYTNDRGDTTYQSAKGAWYKSSDEALKQRKNYGL